VISKCISTTHGVLYTIYAWEHTCLSNTRVLVGKPFYYQTLASPLSNIMTIGTNLPTSPLVLTIEHQERRYCSTISSVDPSKTNPFLEWSVQHRKSLNA
jgi:hypothetical protein